MGKKYARIAAGGSIYILVIIAGLGLRWNLGQAPHGLVSNVANMLRKPDRAKESK